MTLDILFLLVVPTYLVLIAYGQVGARKRGLSKATRIAAGALRVLLPPVALIGALLWEGDAALSYAWAPVVLGMAVAGAIVASLVEVIAPRLGA